MKKGNKMGVGITIGSTAIGIANGTGTGVAFVVVLNPVKNQKNNYL